jgi:hypothetical protein
LLKKRTFFVVSLFLWLYIWDFLFSTGLA